MKRIKSMFSFRLLNRDIPVQKLMLTASLIFTALAAAAFPKDKITVDFQSTDLKTALRVIEERSSYHFMYNDAIVTNKPRISLQAKEVELSYVLDKLLLPNGIIYQFLNNNLIVLKPAHAMEKALSPDRRVTGKVIGTGDQALSGVSVTLKGTTKGTVTDENGNYAIDVSGPESVLVFSYVGYTLQEITVGDRDVVNVIMVSATAELNTVVVVGYGTQRKRDITGSVARVNGTELARQPVLTPTQAMQGKVAGVQIISSGAPNSAPVVRIRGAGSILGGINPLYVVDGVITDDIRNINTADIVSMDVLKDASASAIYGVRAANGVIIITTKKGRTGKTVVNYDVQVGMREAGHLVKMANAKEYATYINEASVNTGNGAVLIDPSLTTTSTDWYGVILRKAFEQNHNLSLSGGSDRGNYFLSLNYLTDEGIVIHNNFQRFTIRSNNEYKFSDKFTVTALLSYGRGTTQDVNLGAAYNNAYHAAPIIPAIINGRYGNTSAYQNVGNPLLDIESNDNKYIENRFQGSGALDFKPVKWITLRTSFGTELGFNNRNLYTNQFFNDTATFLVAGGNQQSVKSFLGNSDERNSRWVWDNTATLQRTFDRHDFTLLAGTTAERVFNTLFTGTISGVPSDPNLRYLSQGDPSTQNTFSSGDERTRNSYIGRLSYAYDKKYLLTATYRVDGSSRFQNKYAKTPSIGLGWVLTNEPFLQKQNLFNFLKLRGSYGRLGNDNIPTEASVQTLSNNLSYFFNGTYNSGIAFNGIIDKDIHWETTDEADLGLEFALLNNKLSGELDVYDKKVNDALVQVNYLISQVTTSVYTNLATIQNRGIELSLQWRDKAWRELSYSLSLNASYNKNNVVALKGGQAIVAGGVGSKGNTTRTDNGHEIGSFYMLEADGVFHNQKELAAYVTPNGTPIRMNGQLPTLGDLKYIDQNGDGVIDDNDRIYAGSYQPKLMLGLNGSFNYKAFDLSFGLYGTIGSKIYNGKKEARFNQKDNIEASVANERWTFTNYASNVPRANLNALPHSTYFLESGNFARLNNITIGYSLPAKVLNRVKLTGLRLFMTGQNIVTITKYSGFTPELSGNILSQGIEYNAYPTTRTYAFGINLTF